MSICNVNSFTTNYSQKLLEDTLAELGLNTSERNVTFEDYDILDWANYLAMLKAFSPSFGDSNRKRLSFDFTSLFCSFSQDSCAINDFKWYYDIYYGGCYPFNSGVNQTSSKKSTQPGSKNGLSLTLFVPSSKDKYSTEYSKGLEPSESDGVNIELSKMTLIAVRKTL